MGLGGGDVGTEASPAPEVVRDIQAVVRRAKAGDTSELPRLRELLAEYPVLAEHYGNLAAQAEAGWAALAAGQDLYMRECLLAHAAALRAELAGPSPAPVERLLVARVVATWLQLNYFASIEPRAIEAGESPKLALYRARRQEQAHRAHLSALAALTMLRKLLPAPVEKALPTTAGDDCDGLGRGNVPVNGHALDLPSDFRNRIATFLDLPVASRADGRGASAPRAIGSAI
jgi:hypothetical protein